MIQFPFMVGIGITFATCYVAKLVLSDFWLDANHKNPLWVGIIISSYSLSITIYFTQIFYCIQIQLPLNLP